MKVRDLIAQLTNFNMDHDVCVSVDLIGVEDGIPAEIERVTLANDDRKPSPRVEIVVESLFVRAELSLDK